MDKFEVLKNFYTIDKKIKNSLINLYPDDAKFDGITYSDKLFEFLKYTKTDLINICNLLEYTEIANILNNYFDNLEQCLINKGCDFDKLSSFYKTMFSNMNSDFINKVNKEIYAFRIESGNELFKNTNSLNETLHLLHKIIETDDLLFSKLPVIKNIERGIDSIFLIGENTDLAQKTLLSIQNAIGTGYTQILSFNEDHILTLIRDKGHALMVEINAENDKYFVSYSIPKCCNEEMIKNLKGINEVNPDFSNGIFLTTSKNLGIDLLEFISNVPNDENMNIFPDENNFTHYTLKDILEKMSFENVIDFVKSNPEIVKIVDLQEILRNKVQENNFSLENTINISKLIDSLNDDVTTKDNFSIQL